MAVHCNHYGCLLEHTKLVILAKLAYKAYKIGKVGSRCIRTPSLMLLDKEVQYLNCCDVKSIDIV